MTLKITQKMAKIGWISLKKDEFLDDDGICGIQLRNKNGILSQIIETETNYLLFCGVATAAGTALIDINEKTHYDSMICIAEDRTLQDCVA